MKTLLLGPVLAAEMAVGLLTSCSAPAVEPMAAPTAQPTAPAPVVAAPPVLPPSAPPTTTTATTTSRARSTERCTNRFDYSKDPRDNATINTLGVESGTCPKPLRSATGGAGGGNGAGYTGTCLDTDTCYDPAGDAPGEGIPDEEYDSSESEYATSGDAQRDYGCQQRYITEGC